MGRGGRGAPGLPFPPNGNGFASPDMMGAPVMGGPAIGPGQMLVLAPGATAASCHTCPHQNGGIYRCSVMLHTLVCFRICFVAQYGMHVP